MQRAPARRIPVNVTLKRLAKEFEIMSDEEHIYPSATKGLAELRRKLAPSPAEAFKAFSQSVFADGALPAKTKQLIAVAVAHVTQCPYCIRGHSKAALQRGATSEEIMEAIWVAAEMRAGGAYAHSLLALDAIDHAGGTQKAS
jgi:AhpD family alkylhydroperoxidase